MCRSTFRRSGAPTLPNNRVSMFLASLIFLGSVTSQSDGLIRISNLEKALEETEHLVVSTMKKKEGAEKDLSVLKRLYLSLDHYQTLARRYAPNQKISGPLFP